MGLVAEADSGSRRARRHSVEQEPARQVDPAAGQVLVRADSEFPAEHPYQVGGVCADRLRCLPERHLFPESGIDQLAQLVRDDRWASDGGGRGVPAQVLVEPLGDEGQAAFRFEFRARLVEGVVQLVDALAQQRVK